MTIPNDFELEEMTQAQVDKYVTHNDDNRRLGAGVVGRLTHNFASDANYTLSTVDGTEEWRYAVIELTDSGVLLTAGRDVVFPAKNGPAYIVTNSTAQILTMKISGQTGTAVAASETLLLYYDGTDISLVGAEHALLAGSTAQAFACSNLAFPATQVPSADPNTLDDYEEGTFTATLTASTPPTATLTTTGNYVKVGGKVLIGLAFLNVDTSGASGAVNVTGLPFTSHSTLRVIGPVQSIDVVASTNRVVAYLNISSTNLRLQDSTAFSNLAISAGTARYLIVTMEYCV